MIKKKKYKKWINLKKIKIFLIKKEKPKNVKNFKLESK